MSKFVYDIPQNCSDNYNWSILALIPKRGRHFIQANKSIFILVDCFHYSLNNAQN